MMWRKKYWRPCNTVEITVDTKDDVPTMWVWYTQVLAERIINEYYDDTPLEKVDTLAKLKEHLGKDVVRTIDIDEVWKQVQIARGNQ